MVFFSCNVCGEALKKNQVDKHCMTKCRGCQTVSCLDCGKEFWGNDYEQHTKCISEEQKYSGKGFVPKVNKGEVKQDRWLEQVQVAIDKNKSNRRLCGPLESLKNYPNVPRKKTKFQNFLKNSLRMRDNSLISQLWEVLMEEAAKGTPQAENNENSSNQTEVNQENGDTINTVDKEENGIDHSQDKKLSKRERKEERKKKMNKKEKKDKRGAGDVSEENRTREKKTKHDHSEENEDQNMKPVKGRKRKRDEVTETIEEEEDVCEDEESEETPVKKKMKFNWENVIMEVLRSKGEISLKKLKKKVLSEYVCQMGEPKSQEQLWSKFNKKVSKNPNFKILKDRVKLWKVEAT